MFYYFVWVRSNKYHGREPLTYSFQEKLTPGTIVRVEMQKDLVPGVISGITTKPKFQTKPISSVLNLPPLPAHLLQLSKWLLQYYPAPIGLGAQQLIPSGLSEKVISDTQASEYEAPALSNLPPLTDEQISAIENMQARDTYLLHGKTGSGKTRIYIELAIKSIEAGKSVIILTPEISLTSQTAAAFRSVFGLRVKVFHSRQAPSERQRTWLECLISAEPLVIVGPRSALFSPLKKIGLIVLDESHEGAYKQEQAPQYLSGRVASYLSVITNSTLILGSATPSVSDYFLAEQKNKPIIRLTKNARSDIQGNSVVVIVDRKEHSLFNQSAYFSQPLIESIEAALSRGEQCLLYLNRRGTARLILCENCGWQAMCPHCDIPLTYHGDKHQLRCHSCNYYSPAPSNCQACGHPAVVYKTAGTKAIVDEVKRIFPNANAARFDTDNPKSESFEENYDQARDGKIDILVGTQMLAKGLDLPKLSTVGILLADTSLYLPDFTAQERTFQLINQVLGRIGRGHTEGHAVIQTYHPDHPILKMAIDNDYEAFYRSELLSREKYNFPPFCYLLKVKIRRASVRSVENAAQAIKEDIEGSGAEVKVEGPAPAFYERLQGKFQWQLVIKSPKRSELLKVIDQLPANCTYDIDPVDLL